MRQRLVAVLSLSLFACSSMGPGTVPHDRIDYANSIGNSWKEQTLLNIVKLRYADMPIFLEVAQVIAGYQLQSAISGSFTLGNFTANLIDRLTAAGTATAGGTYTDRPTVIYQPLTGVDFLKRLMTPIPPSSVLFMLQSGYSAERVMPIMLDSINGINNTSNWLRRSADPKFIRLVELIREGQLADAIQIRIEHPKEGAESSVLIFGPSKDAQLAAKGTEIKSLLVIKPDLREVKVNWRLFGKKRRNRYEDALDAADHARIRGRRAGARGRRRAGESHTRGGRSFRRSIERSAFTSPGHGCAAGGRPRCRAVRREMVLDSRHRHRVQIHFRDHHAVILDSRYRTQGVRSRRDHSGQPVRRVR